MTAAEKRERLKKQRAAFEAALKSLGWTAGRLARECELDKAEAWRYARGVRLVSPAAAISIDRGTRGVLSALKLCPALATLQTNTTTKKAG